MQMKGWSILTLLIFLNFTALPSIAGFFGFDVPATSIIIQEEENHTCSVIIFEKNIPDTLNVHDFIKFFEIDINKNGQFASEDSIYFDPHLTIFSPPPKA